MERPLIGGVFHNSLKQSMLLQCDPTVIYALRVNNEYKGMLTRADLQKAITLQYLYKPWITSRTYLQSRGSCDPGSDVSGNDR